VNAIAPQSGDEIVHVMLPMRLTDGIVVRRTLLDNKPAIATNVPPLRHASQASFDFGNDGPGASDLALACVHAVLARMDYVGPVQKLWDGSRVYRLAMILHAPFRTHFIESAQGDELNIPWSQALGWMRRALLSLVRERSLTQASLLEDWRRSLDALPDPLPQNELDLATLNRQLRDDLIEMTGDASVLSQFLGMIA
jgi:hypothetical protein